MNDIQAAVNRIKADDEVYAAFQKIIARGMGVASYAAEARLENQPGWMEGMVERINRWLELLDDESRVETHGDGIRIFKIVEVER